MPSHLGPLGDGTVICLLGVELHVFPNLPLLLGEFFRRYDAPYPILEGFPLCIQLLNKRLQFLLEFLTGVGIDAFRMFRAVRPGGRVTAFEKVVVELGNAASSQLAGAPHDQPEVGERVLLCLSRVLRHLIAQAPVDHNCSFTQHVAGDVSVDVQRDRRRHMAQYGRKCLDVHTVF